MSTPPSGPVPTGVTPPAPAGAPLSAVPPGTAPVVAVEPEPRATFGWRPGSVRGILALMVLLLLWSVALRSPQWTKEHEIPLIYVYLQYLLVLIIAYYFPPFGSLSTRSRGDRRIIRLWPEIVPWLLLVGSLGLWAWLYYTQREYDYPPRVSFSLPLFVLGGFVIGHALTWLFSRMSGGQLPAWFQDLQAWVALLGMVGLTAELLVHLFVLETLSPERRREVVAALVQWEGLLAALVAFYFGARTETPRILTTGASA
ncbi:MAG TPA: hypothetical protein VNK04_25045 [Gemmataceae bacterium]|nr:hypothetical protein [Gemmataceae bacterium]